MSKHSFRASRSTWTSNYNTIYSTEHVKRDIPGISVQRLSDRRANGKADGVVAGGESDNVWVPLLFAVRMITSAFQEAREIDTETGNPSVDARRAYQWLMHDPKSRYRTEPGTFAAYCAQLGPGYDLQKIRKFGTPVGSYCYKDTEGGIAAIRQVWNKAKFEWYISGGPKQLAASEALLEQIKLKKRARETGQMVLTMEIAVPACAGRS